MYRKPGAPDPIAMSHLNHWYGSGETRIQVIFDATLSIARGSLTILKGPSGSGKTTLLTLIGCLRDVMDGSLRLLGTELNGANEPAQVMLRRKIGFIFQAHNLHASLTAQQNVRMGLEVHGTHGNRDRYDEAAAHALCMVGLEHRLHYLPGNLSGGQKQRVAVARALVGNPEVVMADEPTAALDHESGRVVVEILKALGRERGTTTLMVTHDDRIMDLADRILTMEDGRIVSDTAPR